MCYFGFPSFFEYVIYYFGIGTANLLKTWIKYNTIDTHGNTSLYRFLLIDTLPQWSRFQHISKFWMSDPYWIRMHWRELELRVEMSSAFYCKIMLITLKKISRIQKNFIWFKNTISLNTCKGIIYLSQISNMFELKKYTVKAETWFCLQIINCI
jgi:hypothetical protein